MVSLSIEYPPSFGLFGLLTAKLLCLFGLPPNFFLLLLLLLLFVTHRF